MLLLLNVSLFDSSLGKVSWHWSDFQQWDMLFDDLNFVNIFDFFNESQERSETNFSSLQNFNVNFS